MPTLAALAHRFSRIAIAQFVASTRGNVAITFAIVSIAIVGAAGAAVDYSSASSAKTAMQSALDSTALGLVSSAASLSSADLATQASARFTAMFTRAAVSGVRVDTSYNSTSSVLTLNASGKVPTSLMGIFGYTSAPIAAVSKATLGGSVTWPVCVMITNPTTNHTFLTVNGATVDLNNCMVQVNTSNWDAVEARDTSYIHSANGVNCYVGDLHYGDVTPAKLASCALLQDPYSSLSVPTNTCDYTNKQVNNTTVTLSPGTYCGGLKISGTSNVTLSSGVYYIQSGDFQVLNSANLTGNGVTLLMTGNSTNINITTSGTITMSPTTTGAWAGFLFYWDQTSTSKGSTDVIQAATMNLSGILYFVGQTLSIKGGANVTVNTGSIVADMLLPDNAHLKLTGLVNGTGANLTKALASTTPVLIQ